MYDRVLSKPLQIKKSFFLFGPRGTGKTTWLKKHFPDNIYFDLLDSRNYTDFLAQPARLNNLIPPGYNQFVIIDEIQRVPELLNEIHRLIEAKGFRFVLTGSSARTLRRQGVNLLAGRAYTYHMYPLTAIELGKKFSIETSLQFGHLPSIFSEELPEKYLESYIETYLREEVLQEGITRNLKGFSRFLETAGFSQGSVLNISQVARECALERRSVQNYFDILEDLLIAVRLPVFSRRAKRKLVSHSKFFYFDTGVFRAIRPAGPLDKPAEIEGAALETLVLQELRAVNEYLDLGYTLYFWRTQYGVEVDFILYGLKGLVAIEVKHAAKVYKRDLKNLKAFRQDYPEAHCFLFTMGEREEFWEDVHVIPTAEALLRLPEFLTEQ
jgi:uncharacterized protein